MKPITKSSLPEIKTALPGPKATELLARDEKYISPSYTRSYPLVVQRGHGAILEDVQRTHGCSNYDVGGSNVIFLWRQVGPCCNI